MTDHVLGHVAYGTIGGLLRISIDLDQRLSTLHYSRSVGGLP